MKFVKVSPQAFRFSAGMSAERVLQMLLELKWGGVTHLLLQAGSEGHEELRRLAESAGLTITDDRSTLTGAMEEPLVTDADAALILRSSIVDIHPQPNLLSTSVVIPWDAERPMTPEKFRSFANSLRVRPRGLQTIIVLNGSDDEQLRLIESEFAGILKDHGARDVKLASILCRPGIFRAGLARNFGAQLATGEDLVFLDMDIRPAISFLRASVDQEILLGLRENVLAATGQKLSQNPYWSDFNRNAEQRLSQPQAWKYVCSHSLKMKTSTFRNCGGFAWSFQNYGHEDTEWAYRMAKVGLPFRAHGEPGLHLIHNDGPEINRPSALRKTGEIFLNLHPTFEVETFVRYLWSPASRLKNWATRVRKLDFGKSKTIKTWGPNSKPVTSFPSRNPNF